ncbi:MAG: hypothetical protein ACREJU_13860, partial [Nitrospiraceae bacterium]
PTLMGGVSPVAHLSRARGSRTRGMAKPNASTGCKSTPGGSEQGEVFLTGRLSRSILITC